MTKDKKKIPELRFKGFTDDWEQRKLGELSVVTDTKHATAPTANVRTSFRMIRTSYVRAGELLSDQTESVTEETYNKWSERIQLYAGDIVFSREAPIGEVAIIPDDKLHYFLGQRMVALRTQSETDARFILYTLLAPRFRREVRIRNSASTTVANFGIPDIKKTEVYCPVLAEQKKIGVFMQQLSDAIALHQRKQELLLKLKQGYLQKLFPKNGQKVPELRFPGFTDDWEQRKLGDLFKKSTEKNQNLEFSRDQVLSAATMTDSERDIKSDDDYMRSYNVIRIGDMLFEGHTSKKFEFGRFVVNDYRSGIVSHVFDVYKPIEQFNLSFLSEYIHNESVMRPILVKTTSSARMLNSLDTKSFLKQYLRLPSNKEQEQIGMFLERLSDAIALHQKQIDSLKDLKKAYLQKLFV